MTVATIENGVASQAFLLHRLEKQCVAEFPGVIVDNLKL
jgi:hypothetical protein